MAITAKVIADSLSWPAGKRITTLQLRYPRFIHSEFMTHRMFSRNASSSRAIPVERMVADIQRETAMPIHWGKNQAGMQAREKHDSLVMSESGLAVGRESAWLDARDCAVRAALAFHRAGYHKQIVNRLLEPFSHINVVVTATEWENFFSLRAHPDAQPEIQALALAMKKAMGKSTPEKVYPGGWHLPYVQDSDWDQLADGDPHPRDEILGQLIKVSIARCARVSYLTHSGKPSSHPEDVALADRLLSSKPFHASPTEHQAMAVGQSTKRSNNFFGWHQLRESLDGLR